MSRKRVIYRSYGDSLLLHYAIARKRKRSDCELTAFELFFHVGEKLLGIRAIDDPVVKAEREIRHVANRDVVFAVRRRENFGALFDLADTEDGHLRLVDDGGTEQAAKDTRVRDGKGPAGNFVWLELLRARALSQVIRRAGQT